MSEGHRLHIYAVLPQFSPHEYLDFVILSYGHGQVLNVQGKQQR